MRGRKPKPTALKLMDGNPGKRRLNAKEPKANIEVPDCPETLNDLARAEWDRITVELVKAGMLTNLDRAALALYCQTWAIWIEAEERVKTKGRVFVSKSGHPLLNPWHSIATKAFGDLKAIASEFGLTPSARSRIDIDTTTEKADPLTLFTEERRA